MFSLISSKFLALPNNSLYSVNISENKDGKKKRAVILSCVTNGEFYFRITKSPNLIKWFNEMSLFLYGHACTTGKYEFKFVCLMSLVAHRFGHVEFRIFVLTFSRAPA